MSNLKFRTDINGLRSIAVLMVVFYHFKIPFFAGGFSGVDIFFVISGFLMSTIYLDKIENGYKGILVFYKSRFDRIYPALISLIAICFFYLYFSDAPFIIRDFFDEAKYAAFFVSNIYYQHNSGYFDVSSEYRWLLHTWSLSVEWQFYILFPLLVFLFSRLFSKNKLVYFYVVMFFVSFFYCVFIALQNQNDAFYSLSSRAWELFIGAIVSLVPDKVISNKRRIVEVVGIAVIIFSLFFITDVSIWPNYYTLVRRFSLYVLVDEL